MPAFLHAISLGVDVLELDVVISADRQVVISHEPWLNPIICRGPANESIQHGSASSYNLYQMPYHLIEQCDCGHPHPNFPQQVALPAVKPLLRDVLAATEALVAQLPSRRPLGYSIEIKCLPEGDNIFHPAPPAFLDLVLAQLNQAGVTARCTVLCFDARILRLARAVNPELRTCLLVEAEQDWFSSLKDLGFVPHAFGPNQITVTPAAVSQIRTQYPSLRIVPWTVNEPADFARLIELGVDGITTDYPDRLVALLDKKV
ncbi:glycerophosphodiester phosphodiesterase family protein [Hymenobacter glaciei]|uniref:Glycerophosphodiester phosphodiesterase family protein n=1 Tax=Hymenobacter glaciei TaxID=877209 RepID=A0ABP7U8X1_9BACT